MTSSRLILTRPQILAFRRRVGAVEERLPIRASSLQRAAWAGLQDSMPRAALLSIHARIVSTRASSWEDPSLIQIWGPRHNAYVVARRDLAVFSASPRFDSEHLQKLRGRMPLDTRVLEVVVVRPHWKVQREREGEHIHVVRIALADAASSR